MKEKYMCLFCEGQGTVKSIEYKLLVDGEPTGPYAISLREEIDDSLVDLIKRHAAEGTYRKVYESSAECPVCKGVCEVDWLTNVTKNRIKKEPIEKEITIK